MNKYQVSFLVLSLMLISIWFSSGKQLATGEEGLSIFNPISIEEQVSLWQQSGTGYPLPFYVLRLIPLLFNSIFIKVGFPLFLTQAVFYFFILLSGFIGAFLMSKHLIGERKNLDKLAFLASLFYAFNLYTFTQVFSRFLYSGMLLWAYLPIFLLLWIKWITKKSFKYLFIFLTSSLLYSLTYLQPAHIITLWTPPIVWFLIWLAKNSDFRKEVVFAAVLGILLWIVINIWWIYPYWVVGRYVFYAASLKDSHFNSLMGVSSGIKLSHIPTLWHGLFLGEQTPWGWFYQADGVFYGLRWVPFFLLLIGVFSFLKNRNFFFLFFLLIVGWFVSKGTNPPLGYVFYKFLFYTFPFTAVLRNPYEKFGLVFVLPYSIFFALGLNWLYEKLKPTLREFVVSSVLILSCGVLVWPMWTGDIYKDKRIEVPVYYKEANKFLEQSGGDGRILMLPLIPGDGVRTKWGYGGIEPSEFLFDRSTISKILRTKYYDDVYWNLYQDLNERIIIDSDKLKNLNVSFIILRKDLEKGLSDKGLSIKDVKKVVLQNSDLEYLATFGDLEIYSFKPNKQGLIFDVDSDKKIGFSYQKLSPTRYKVYIKAASQPFNLIFKSTYNDLWEARIGKEKLDRHFLAYDYANGWEVDKKGNFIIDVIFKVWPWE